MQMVRREAPANGMHFLGHGLARLAAQAHPAMAQAAIRLAQIAGRAGRHDVFPAGNPPARTRHDMVESQLTLGSAILAAEFVAQKKIEARECHALLGSDIIFQHDDRGDFEGLPLTSHDLLIFGDDTDPFQKHRLDGFLPGPQRQRIITEWPVIRVQNQGGVMAQIGRFPYELGSKFRVMSLIQHPLVPPVLPPPAKGACAALNRLYLVADE